MDAFKEARNKDTGTWGGQGEDTIRIMLNLKC